MKDFTYYSTATKNSYPSSTLSKQIRNDVFSVMEVFVGTKLQIEEKEANLETAYKNRIQEMRVKYNTELLELKNEFKSDMESAFGVSDNPKKDLLFSKAWDLGHSSGVSDVYHYYGELVDLIE